MLFTEHQRLVGLGATGVLFGNAREFAVQGAITG
jgi:hypothetical protein